MKFLDPHECMCVLPFQGSFRLPLTWLDSHILLGGSSGLNDATVDSPGQARARGDAPKGNADGTPKAADACPKDTL